MERKMILSKNTLLYYIMNEFGNNSDINLEVTEHLDDQGGWTGKISISSTETANQDDAYLTLLVETIGHDYSFFNEKGIERIRRRN